MYKCVTMVWPYFKVFPFAAIKEGPVVKSKTFLLHSKSIVLTACIWEAYDRSDIYEWETYLFFHPAEMKSGKTAGFYIK